MDIKSRTITFNLRGDDVLRYECDSCGALVTDVQMHSKFHSDVMYARDPKESGPAS